MKIQSILKAENVLATALEQAKHQYTSESNKLRQQAGVYLRTIRETAGISVLRMAALLNLDHPKSTLYQAEDGVRNRDGTKRYYSVEKLAELAALYEKAIAVLAAVESTSRAVARVTPVRRP
jgi:hypothetical protein